MTLFVDTITVGAAGAFTVGTTAPVGVVVDGFIAASSATQVNIPFTTASMDSLVVVVLAGFNIATQISSAGTMSPWSLAVFNTGNTPSPFGYGIYMYYTTVTTPNVADSMSIQFTGAGSNSGALYYWLQQYSPPFGSLTQWYAQSFTGFTYTATTSFPWGTLVTPSSGFGVGIFGMYISEASNYTAPLGVNYTLANIPDATDGKAMVVETNPMYFTASHPQTVTSSVNASADTIGELFIGTNGPKNQFTTATYQLGAIPAGTSWVVSHIGFTSPAALAAATEPLTAGAGTATVFLNGTVVAANLSVVNGVFSGPPYVTVRSSDLLTVTVTGAPAGVQIILSIGYQPYATNALPTNVEVY